MTSIDYPRPWYHVISLLCLNSAGEERRIRGSPCLQRPVPRQLQRSLCDLVLQPKWTHSFVQDYSVLPCQNVPNSHEPISFRNGNTLEGLSFFGFSCPLLSTRPLHRKVADKDYLNNGLGDLAGFAVFPPSYWCTALVAALLWAPFKTRRVEIWYRYDEMRWNDMWYMCTYEMSDSEWLQGYECHMKDDKTCGNGKLCGVQNPPESLGEKQCFVMASERCDAVPGVHLIPARS